MLIASEGSLLYEVCYLLYVVVLAGTYLVCTLYVLLNLMPPIALCRLVEAS